MSTNSNKNLDKLRDRIKALEQSKTEAEKLNEETFILMANYLSEIEKFQRFYNLKRKDLAKQIGTSPSYLTQVFTGVKPLNFSTIAKIKQVLGLVFVVRAYPKDTYKSFHAHVNQQMFDCRHNFGSGLEGSDNKLIPITGTNFFRITASN